jgi:hypothetical protein
MKKETLQQIFKRTVTKNLLDVIFVKPPQDTITTEDALLEIMNIGHRIKVQSVVLPKEHQLYTLKTEAQILDWLQNKLHNVNTAFHKINSKYDGDTERVNWNNNKMQNQRFLEIKNMYKGREE